MGVPIGDGTTTKAGHKFTTPSWPSGYTIPATTMTFKLKRIGDGFSSGSHDIDFKVYKNSGADVIASGTVFEHADDISVAGELYTVVLESTEEMEPLTEYYGVAEYTGGNPTHHIEVRASDVGTSITYDTAWNVVPDVGIIGKLNVGLPPKASFGGIHNRNLWIGGDPDRLGEVNFSKNTQYDWGYIGVMDESKSSYKVGGLQSVYGQLYIYGQEASPYLCTLTGANEDEYGLPALYQKQWTTPRTVVNAINDIWTANSSGVDSLKGVQEYGDVRNFSESDAIFDKFRDHWDDATAFAGYAAKEGQYVLAMPTLDKLLICQTRLPAQGIDGRTRYPWAEITTPFTPKSFGQFGDNFIIGAADGYLYTYDYDSVYDLGTTKVSPEFSTLYQQLPFRGSYINDLQMLCDSLTGAAFDITAYKNGSVLNIVHTWPMVIPIHDDVIIAAFADIKIADATFALGPGAPLDQNLDFMARSFLIKIHNVSPAGAPLFIDGLVVRHRPLEE